MHNYIVEELNSDTFQLRNIGLAIMYEKRSLETEPLLLAVSHSSNFEQNAQLRIFSSYTNSYIKYYHFHMIASWHLPVSTCYLIYIPSPTCLPHNQSPCQLPPTCTINDR